MKSAVNRKTPATTREHTRALLIRAAEHEMARHGIEGADLSRINAAAAQRNSSAIHYHFGSRGGLVEAIIAEHRAPIDAERTRTLDRLERSDAIALRTLIETMVLPTARRLEDPSRRDYIVIVAEGSTRLGTTGLFHADQPFSDGLRRVNAHLADAVAGAPTERRVRVGQANLGAIVFLADVARDIDAERITITQGRRRVRKIVDLLHGGLSAPPPPGHSPRPGPS